MGQFALAYVAGLVTILSPCVLAMLPIVLAGALNTHRYGPIALAGGLVLSFTAFGLFIATLGFSLGLTPTTMSKIAAAIMLVFGLVMLSGNLQMRFAVAADAAVSGLNERVSTFSPQTLSGQFMLGGLLGAVWTPCVGPTLGAAIALAAQGKDISYAALIMFLFALGSVTPLMGLMYGTREAITARKSSMAAAAHWVKPLLGGLLVLVSLLILTGLMTKWETYLLDVSPPWLIQFIYQF
ncbi:MAG: cytochrome c biogenesis CcdA family protein [Pseudomonadota bacterium]